MNSSYFLFILIISGSCLLLACQNVGNNNNNNPDKNTNTAIATTTPTELIAANSNDSTLFINKTCLVFLQPDSADIAQLEKQIGHNQAHNIMREMFVHKEKVMLLADSLELPTIVTIKKYLVFELPNNQTQIVKVRQINGDLVMYKFGSAPQISAANTFGKNTYQKYYGQP